MKKIVKNYIEKLYKGVFFSDYTIDEVNERNPLKIKNDLKMQGFRFF